MRSLNQIKPLLTEKTSILLDSNNVYVFKVGRQLSKPQIKEVIEKNFSVEVVSVRTLISHVETKRRGKSLKKGGAWKKAYAVLKSGNKIDFGQGV